METGIKIRTAAVVLAAGSGKRMGSSIPVVVTIIRLIRPDTGIAKSIPSTTPLPTAVIYCIITCPVSCFPVNPMVFRMP